MWTISTVRTTLPDVAIMAQCGINHCEHKAMVRIRSVDSALVHVLGHDGTVTHERYEFPWQELVSSLNMNKPLRS